MKDLQPQIKKLKAQEDKISKKRRILEDKDYEANQEKRIQTMLGKFYEAVKRYDYEKGAYGRVISYKWVTENGRRHIQTITESISFFDWQVEIQYGHLTAFQPDHDVENQWKRIDRARYEDKRNEGLANFLNLN